MKVHRFLSGLRSKKPPLSGITRNEHIASIKAFTKRAVEARRITADPLASLKRAERKAIRRTHLRRALTVPELAKFLVVAANRALKRLLTACHGRKHGRQEAKLRPSFRERARLVGKHWRFAYPLALRTGLRRSEMAAVTWGDIDLDALVPVMR